MKFWRIGSLKKQLQANPLSEREALPYLLGYIGVTEMALSFPRPELNQWNYVLLAVGSLVSIGGTIYVYRCNGGAHGKYFFQRYFSLGWVNAIRFGFWSIPLYIAFVFWLDLKEETTWQSALFWSLFSIFLFSRLAHHIKGVAFPDE